MRSRYRWFVVIVFFSLMLLHNADKFLIGPLTTPIMEEFGIKEAQKGAVATGALVVTTICYLAWGYLYDRYARPKLVALAALLAGLIAVRSSLSNAIVLIGVGAWGVAAVLNGVAAYLVPKDIASLCQIMSERADRARRSRAQT
jgi:MFS family permease